MFPQFSSWKYKRFNIWRKLKYLKFILKNNGEFDWYYLIEMNILKLTMMGLQFAKFGIVIDEDRKKQVHTIWEARKNLKNCLNAFEITHARAQKKFNKKFGFDYNWAWSPFIKGFQEPHNFSDEQLKEIEEYWRECYGLLDDYNFEIESLKKASDIILQNLFSWWD